jgi:hypothetical protein
MTNEEIDKIIFDTIPAPIEAGIDEMRSLVLAGMRAEREACAQIVDTLDFNDISEEEEAQLAKRYWGHEIPMVFHADRIAAAIRKRGEG